MNDTHRFLCLNNWSPVGGSVWERLGVMALGKYITGVGFEISKDMGDFQCALSFQFVGQV